MVALPDEVFEELGFFRSSCLYLHHLVFILKVQGNGMFPRQLEGERHRKEDKCIVHLALKEYTWKLLNILLLTSFWLKLSVRMLEKVACVVGGQMLR